MPKMKKSTVDSKDLSHVQYDFVGNINAIRVEHTNEGVRVTGHFNAGLKEIRCTEVPNDVDVAKVNRAHESQDYDHMKDHPEADEKDQKGETATLANAQATASDPDVEGVRRELRDDQARGDLPDPGVDSKEA